MGLRAEKNTVAVQSGDGLVVSYWKTSERAIAAELQEPKHFPMPGMRLSQVCCAGSSNGKEMNLSVPHATGSRGGYEHAR